MAVRIKICGITRKTDIDWAVQLGADALGVNFYPSSPRYLDTNTAATILRGTPPFVTVVGVFVNENLTAMTKISQEVGRISVLQCHGQIPQPTGARPFQFVPAFAIKDRDDLDRITRYLDACRETGLMPDGLLLDAHDPLHFGGTGRTAPWELLADFHPGPPIILAGGLTAENVAEAIRLVQPYAVDVASGIESQPGIKDHEKLARFISAVRSI
jgi:phosphoribosylanthranilate isomerase